LKWAILLGLVFGVVRLALFALNLRTALLIGITLHGACYVLFTVVAQIYLAERVERTMQARAQALFGMLTSGVSNLLGYLGTGGWFLLMTHDGVTRWSLYWSGLCAINRGHHGVFRLGLPWRGPRILPPAGGQPEISPLR